MERLTYWNEEYGCWSYKCASGDAAKCLAAYEGTGLTPEQIEAQRQEIDRLKKLVVRVQCDRDIEASRANTLVSDKDQQTGTIMRYEAMLKEAQQHLTKYRKVYGSIGAEAIAEKIDALLGGAEG